MEPMKVMRGGGSFRSRQQRKRKKQISILALVLAVVMVVLCIFVLTRSKDPETSDAVPIVAAAQVNSKELKSGEKVSLNMTVGEIAMLTLPDDVEIRWIDFASENNSIVRADAAGRLDALQPGTAKIIATGVGFNAICECTVAAADKVEEKRSDRLTTAITANAEIEKKNAAKDTNNLYSITVNRRTNVVTVYTYDDKGKYTVPVRAMVCSCGAGGEDTTPTGVYQLTDYRVEWDALSGDVYGQYISQFFGDFLFHSVPYTSMSRDSLKTDEFNKLGTNASQGCVRMMISDVLWIYEECAVGTSVEVIDDDESADPLGKPQTVTIDGSVKWDPTDPDPANPYKGRQPEITGAVDATLKKDGSFNAMEGVTATDTCGSDITDRVLVAGKVISEKAGVYFLTYSVTDAFGQECEVTRVIIVE